MTTAKGVWALAILVACSSEPVDLLPLDGSTDTNVADAAEDVALDVAAECGGGPCECSNGLDDDGDGAVDGFDVECTSNFDDDEGSFGTGRPGDNRDPFCQDCFFDGNSGTGDDGCRYPTQCLVSGTAPLMDPCGTCEVAAECITSCRDLTPNGCDCFGCCTIQVDGTTIDVAIGERCSLENLDDLESCPRCIPSTECNNPCGRCELCPGRTAAELPPDCDEPFECEGGLRCDSDADCEGYCQLGCCLAVLI